MKWFKMAEIMQVTPLSQSILSVSTPSDLPNRWTATKVKRNANKNLNFNEKWYIKCSQNVWGTL